MASDRRRAGVTRRRKPLVDCATQPTRPEALVEEAKVKVFRPQQRTCLTQNLHLCVHGEPFTGCAVRFAVKISQEDCASEQWLVAQRSCEDCDRILLKTELKAWLGLEKNNDFLEIDLTSWQQTYSWIWNVEPS